MKRILIAVAALGLMAGPAVAMDDDGMMAEGPTLSLSGSAGLGATFLGEVKDSKTNTVKEKSQIKFENFAKVAFTGSGVTDGGLTFGMKVRVNTSKVDDGEIHIGGEMWKLTVGDNDSASNLAFDDVLGDVGFDGNLGVDDVAEKAHKRPDGYNDSEARVDLTFGVAKIAVSVGQTPGSEYMAAEEAFFTQRWQWHNGKAGTARKGFNIEFEHEAKVTGGLTQAPPTTANFITAGTAGADNLIIHKDGTQYYGVGDYNGALKKNAVYVVNGLPDTVPGKTVNPGDADPAKDGVQKDTLDEVVYEDVHGFEPVPSAAIVFTPYEEAKPATKQETNWSVGTAVDLGAARLGFGLDSEKKMSVSVSGKFGMVGGGLYYSQQDVEMTDGSEDKWTGLGAQVSVDVVEGTVVTIVGAQRDRDRLGKNDAFGVGVTHDLGGGAEVQAGFAQVNDQNKASAGIAMTF